MYIEPLISTQGLKYMHFLNNTLLHEYVIMLEYVIQIQLNGERTQTFFFHLGFLLSYSVEHKHRVRSIRVQEKII